MGEVPIAENDPVPEAVVEKDPIAENNQVSIETEVKNEPEIVEEERTTEKVETSEKTVIGNKEEIISKIEEEKSIEKPPPSPLDPPVVNAAFFAQDNIEKPRLLSTIIPPPPKIEPMPPPPPGIEPLVFQPIQSAAPTSGGAGVPLVNPRPVMPNPNNFSTSPLSSYFPLPSNTMLPQFVSTNISNQTGTPHVGPGSGNPLLTAAFTPTLGALSNTVFLAGPVGQGDHCPTQTPQQSENDVKK